MRRNLATKEQILKNIEMFESYLIGESESDKKFAFKILRAGQNYIAYEIDGNYHFIPSRYVGYENATRANYDKYKGNGSSTDLRITRELCHSHFADDELEYLFLNYCNNLKTKKPHKKDSKGSRQYWRLNDAVTIKENCESNSGSTAQDSYKRYVEAYEIKISPAHHDLQKRFVSHLKNKNYQNIKEDIECVDVRYTSQNIGNVFAEIKPCSINNVRYAIRTAMGQLLDYRQRATDNPFLIVVVSVEPNLENKNLLMENSFGIAYPNSKGFTIELPQCS